jgi:hypothetical protein
MWISRLAIKDITAFVVDRNTPGLQIGNKEDKVHSFSICVFIFSLFVLFDSFELYFTLFYFFIFYSIVGHLSIAYM